MRDIKFRAWDKKTKQMVRSEDLYRLSQREDGIFAIVGCIDKQEITTFHDDLVLMEFTGLLDKNGKEIYEGDIIAQKECGYKNKFHREGIIEYKDSGFIVKGDDESYDYLKTQHRFLEAIGNIYENPELLRK
jgi:uncharacterized phage protein (TIGR01671 family)